MARYQPASSARKVRSSAAWRKYVAAPGSPSQCSMRATGSSSSQLVLPGGRSSRFHASASSLRNFFSFTPSNPTPLLGPTSTDTPESIAGGHTSMSHEDLLYQLGTPARMTRRPASRLEVRFLLWLVAFVGGFATGDPTSENAVWAK